MKNRQIFLVIFILIASCSNVKYTDMRLKNNNRTICGDAEPYQLTTGAAPRYPRELRVAGVEGYVYLKLDVTKGGIAENISVIASRPSGTFDAYAIEAAQKWKYRPTILH